MGHQPVSRWAALGRGHPFFPHVAQPLSVCVFVRRADHDATRPARIHYRALHGKRAEKFTQLRAVGLDDDGWWDAHARGTRPFTPAALSGWEEYLGLDALLPWGSLGFTTNRSWVTSPHPSVLQRRWAGLCGEQDPEAKALLFKETGDRRLDARVTCLLRYLSGVLGLDGVTVHDLAAYAVAVAGHTAFTEQFAEELLTPGVRLPLTRDPDLWSEAVRVGRAFLWAATYGEQGDPLDAPTAGEERVDFPPGDPRQVRYVTPIGSAVPNTLAYDEESGTLHVGPGTFTGVPPEVWNYEVGGMRIVKKWFGYRTASPTIRKTSPLDDIHVISWPREWTEELIELLSVLRRLVALGPAQQALTTSIVDSPVVTLSDLTSAGVLPPHSRVTKARRRVVLDFDTPDEP
ncbi:hypothetical protein N6Q81_28995 [Streptomyces vinaceusdrappus]|uniref:Type ISP restriction-modification enzyme LLaBIII C-terminal specificity domain-containing protein n=1 Tax=Streptomyces vinaceusdrappus TaxID=67376 RepID=A0ABY6C1X5_9ACTN|nr:type ISP restriction/modification enzyme [Streptomyces vinaceusdrappus]UXI81802.1 hypothetical protein N6Q81_28995 [Streptomyces vinaceusdrappus]